MGNCLLAITGAFHSQGGIAAVNRLMIRALAEENHHLDIFCLGERDGSPDERYTAHAQAEYRCFSGQRFTFGSAVWKSLSMNTYDHVIADHVNLASVLAVPSRLRRCRYATWLFGMEVFPPRPDFEGRIGLRHASKRLAISAFTARMVSSRFPSLRVDVCPLALDPVRHSVALAPARDMPRFLNAVDGVERRLGAQMILHVGRMSRLEQYKGQQSLLNAMPYILQRFPLAQLVLAGDGDDRNRLLGIAKSLSAAVQRSVFMPGHVDNVLLNDLYETCYVFAMPSFGEGFGLVYLEAMVHGKPCLGGRVDAAGCVIQDEVTGVLVDDPRCRAQLADKLMSLLGSPQRARALGRAGYQKVQSDYLFCHFKQRFLQVLSD